MIVDFKQLTADDIDTMFPVVVELDEHPDFPFAIKEDEQSVLLSTAEAKALLKFLKKHLEPKLENV